MNLGQVGGIQMDLREFMDMKKLQKIQDDFSNATGLAAIAVGKDGEYLTEGSNFTEFCMKYTRGSTEGNRRCIKCDNECKGTYFCHAGLMDFSVDIIVNGERMGAVIGGQVLPNEPDEEKFRQTAKEFFKYNNAGKLDSVKDNIKQSGELVQTINEKTGYLKGIAKKQTILSLNATIEAARSGEAGVGFAVVAKSMQDLSNQSAGIYNDIEKSVEQITQLINSMTSLFDE